MDHQCKHCLLHFKLGIEAPQIIHDAQLFGFINLRILLLNFHLNPGVHDSLVCRQPLLIVYAQKLF